MTLTRANPGGWAPGSKLTSAQANAMDSMIVNAVDGRSPGLEIASRSVTRAVNSIPHTVGNFTLDTQLECQQSSIGSSDRVLWPLDIPNGATITACSVSILPAGSHAGLPATMPEFRLTRRSILVTGSLPNLGSATDSSANVTAYQTQHTIALTGLSVVVDTTAYLYFLRLTGESGANSLAGLMAAPPTYTFTTTKLDER